MDGKRDNPIRFGESEELEWLEQQSVQVSV